MPLTLASLPICRCHRFRLPGRQGGASNGEMGDQPTKEQTDAGDAGEVPRLKPTSASVIKHLVAIAEDRRTNPKERIAALDSIARIKGMVVKRSETTLKVAPNVMLVPFIPCPEKWEELARLTQAKLKAEAEAPAPSDNANDPPTPQD